MICYKTVYGKRIVWGRNAPDELGIWCAIPFCYTLSKQCLYALMFSSRYNRFAIHDIFFVLFLKYWLWAYILMYDLFPIEKFLRIFKCGVNGLDWDVRRSLSQRPKMGCDFSQFITAGAYWAIQKRYPGELLEEQFMIGSVNKRRSKSNNKPCNRCTKISYNFS